MYLHKLNASNLDLRMVLATAALLAVAAPAKAIRAVLPTLANDVTWNADGAIEATVFETESIASIQTNSSLNFNHVSRVGQTFRCAGPVLAAVQLGHDDADTDATGLFYRLESEDVPVTAVLRRGGPNGPVIVRRTFTRKDFRRDPWSTTNALMLEVDRPSDPSKLWYVEVSTAHQNFGNYKIYVYATAHDTYRGGSLFLDGKAVDGDLQMRVTRAKQVRSHRPGQVVFWSARPEEHIWMDPDKTIGLMLADDSGEPVRLEAARNEWVSRQFVVTPHPDHRIDRAVLSLSSLEGPGGARIAPEHVRIEWLRYSLDFKKAAKPFDSLDFKKDKTSGRMYPDPLAPTNIADIFIDRRINHGFWVSIKVPPDTPAGVYRSTATVQVNETLTLTRPIELEVFDFDLPQQTHTRMGLFHAVGGTLDAHLWWVNDMADFRIPGDCPFYIDQNGFQHPRKFNEESYKFILGPSLQKSLVVTGELLNRRGLAVGCVTPWGDSYRMMRGEPGGHEGIIRYWKTYYPILKQNGWTDQAYCRMPDERHWRDMGNLPEIVKLFRAHAPGVKIMVTEMNAAASTDALSKAIGIADIWCQGLTFMPLTMDFYKERMAKGEEVWPYIHAYLATNVDPVVSRLFFWMLQKHGLGGACYFSMKRAHFEPTWHGVRRYTDTFVGDGDLYYDLGITPENNYGMGRSVRLYRIADGLEDREIFWLMNDLARRADAAGKLSSKLEQRVANANAMLDDMVIGMTNFSHDLDRIDAIRRELAGVIIDLRRTVH